MLNDDQLAKVSKQIEMRFDELSVQEGLEEGPTDFLYHYTGVDGLLGIIKSRALWATNILYLNDSSEMAHARQLVSDELQKKPFNLGDDAKFLSREIAGYVTGESLEHFVVSFCEDGDLLSQWRGYGSLGNGYSIGFGSTALLRATHTRERCVLRKVKYNMTNQIKMIQSRIEVVRDIVEPLGDQLNPERDNEYRSASRFWIEIASALQPTLALMKHVAFVEEREWRIVQSVWKKPVPGVDWPVLTRVANGRLLPYVPVGWSQGFTPNSLENKEIKRIFCGPSAMPDLKKKAVETLCIAEHLDAKIDSSQAPLRF